MSGNSNYHYREGVEMDAETLVEYDILRTCRSCLADGDQMISLNKLYNANSEYADSSETIGKLLMTCANVQVASDDGLPQIICVKCFLSIRAAVAFRQMCELSETELREKLQSQLPNVSVKLESIDVENDFQNVSVSNGNKHEPEETFPEVQVMLEDSVPCDMPLHILDVGRIEKKPKQKQARSAAKTGISGRRKSTKKSTGESKEERIKSKKYTCEICAMDFDKQSDLSGHRYLHTDRKEFLCETCNRMFQTEQTLLYHVKRFHDVQVLRHAMNSKSSDNLYRRTCRKV